MPLKVIKAILDAISEKLQNFTPESVKKATSMIENYRDCYFKKKSMLKQLRKVMKDLAKIVPKRVLHALELETMAFRRGEYDITSFGEVRRISTKSRRIFNVPLNKLRFRQDYVQEETVRAKKRIAADSRLLDKDLREFFSEKVRKEVGTYDLTLPIIVTVIYDTDSYLVLNGVHTVYAYYQLGKKGIEAEIDDRQPVILSGEFITIGQIRIE